MDKATLDTITHYALTLAQTYYKLPLVALNHARKILELVSKELYKDSFELTDKAIKNHQLQKILEKLNKGGVVPKAILLNMHTIQHFGNFGSHHHDCENILITANFVKPCIAAINFLLEWYFCDYLNDGKTFKNLENLINQTVKLEKNIAIYQSEKEKIRSFKTEKLRDLTYQVKSDLESIHYFKDKFTLFSIQKTLPEPNYIGNYSFSTEKMPTYQQEEDKFYLENRHNTDLTNEPHAIMNINPKLKFNVKKDIKKLDYYTTNYIGIRALRRLGLKPQIISAGAITISPLENKIYFQLRGDKVATYKNHFHIMGGNYIGMVKNNLDVSTNKQDIDLSHTIFREILEESNITADIDDCKTGLYSIGIENDTGFIQVEAHAVCLLSAKDLQYGREEFDLIPNWEGNIYGVNLDSLEDFLKYSYDKWVPSGLAHVLIWLALDAPYAPQTNGYAIYERVIDHIKDMEV